MSGASPQPRFTLPALRPRRKWPIVWCFWAVQTLFIFAFFPMLDVLAGGTWADFLDFFDDADYVFFAASYAVCVTLIQGAFLAPIARPRVKDDPRPGLSRFLVCGMGIGVVAGIVASFALFAGDVLNIIPGSPDGRGVSVIVFSTAVVVGPIAVVLLHAKYRDGLPAGISTLFAAMLAGLLLTGTLLLILDAAELAQEAMGVSDPDMPDWLWKVAFLAGPVVGWIAATPLILGFVRRGHPESQLSRLANAIFIGTLIEAVITIPIYVMVRRKSMCYCAEGSFWSLIIFGSVGLVALGPAMYLLPIGKRRRRLTDGCCPACGYDLRSTPEAPRCPECGAGWRES